MKIYGRNPVAEALSSGRTIDRLVVQDDLKDAEANRIIADAKSRGLKIFFREKEYLDREVEKGVRHQGFIAEITDFTYSEIDDIFELAESKGEPPFIVILDGVEDPHNLGSVLRVCECAGVHGVIIPRHRSVSVNETVMKVSSGAAAHVLVAKVVNINEAIERLKERGVWVYCADMAGEDVYSSDLSGAAAFVIGGEGKGVGRLTKSLCDKTVSIPMRGKVNSLNASVACGIVVYEKIRSDKAFKPLPSENLPAATEEPIKAIAIAEPKPAPRRQSKKTAGEKPAGKKPYEKKRTEKKPYEKKQEGKKPYERKGGKGYAPKDGGKNGSKSRYGGKKSK